MAAFYRSCFRFTYRPKITRLYIYRPDKKNGISYSLSPYCQMKMKKKRKKRRKTHGKWKILQKSIAFTKNHENVKKIENETKLMSLLCQLLGREYACFHFMWMNDWHRTQNCYINFSKHSSVFALVTIFVNDFTVFCMRVIFFSNIFFFIRFEIRKKNNIYSIDL